MCLGGLRFWVGELGRKRVMIMLAKRNVNTGVCLEHMPMLTRL